MVWFTRLYSKFKFRILLLYVLSTCFYTVLSSIIIIMTKYVHLICIHAYKWIITHDINKMTYQLINDQRDVLIVEYICRIKGNIDK